MAGIRSKGRSRLVRNAATLTQQAGALAAQGNFGQAMEICDSLLQAGIKDVTLWHLAGMLYYRSGKQKKGIQLLKRAAERPPRKFQVCFDLGSALRAQGQVAAAVKHLRRALALKPHDLPASNALAMALKDSGDLAEAIGILRTASAKAPGHPGIKFNLANAYREIGDHAQAIGLYEDLVQTTTENPGVLNNLGQSLRKMDREHEAVECFRSAVRLDPESFVGLNNLGICLAGLGDYAQAAKAFERSLALDDQQVPILNQAGTAYLELAAFDKAQVSFRRAIQIDARDLHAYRNLCITLERCNQAREARQVAEAGLAECPADVELRLMLARCERRLGHLGSAKEILSQIGPGLEGDQPRRFHNEFGLTTDRLGEFADAWTHFEAAGSVTESQAPIGAESNRLVDVVAGYRDILQSGSWEALHESETPRPIDVPIFLVGFPRSGTTLFDQFLAGHPDLQTLEERPTLDSLVDVLCKDYGSLPGALKKLGPADISRLRNLYWETVDQHLKRRANSRLIDRMPLDLLHVPLVSLLWPDALFIFCRRHPLDTCLSCFFQDFRDNQLTVHFHNMAQTVQLYETVMALWLDYRQTFADRIIEPKYESLVVDPNAVMRKIIDFLGLEWTDSVLDHVSTAKSRSELRTISYHQVVQPLYRSSIERWRNYQTQLEPWIAQLNPFVSAFGYGDSG